MPDSDKMPSILTMYSIYLTIHYKSKVVDVYINIQQAN